MAASARNRAKYQGARTGVAQRVMANARAARVVSKGMSLMSRLGVVTAGANFASGNVGLGVLSLGYSGYAAYRSDVRAREAENGRLKSRALDSLINRARTGNTLGVRTGRRADAGGGARLALARAAATRTAVATRSTSVLGMRSSSRVASVTPRGSNGQVKAYTRMQNGQAIFVGGYSRTV